MTRLSLQQIFDMCRAGDTDLIDACFVYLEHGDADRKLSGETYVLLAGDPQDDGNGRDILPPDVPESKYEIGFLGQYFVDVFRNGQKRFSPFSADMFCKALNYYLKFDAFIPELDMAEFGSPSL